MGDTVVKNSEYSDYRSPLATRYASKEMRFNFSEQKKFSTWRRLWIYLAKAEMVEEIGVRDESGRLQISKTEIRNCLKRGGSQRRIRDDFLEKSIKNYLQEKSAAQSMNDQRNKCVESMERTFGRVPSFSGRRRSQKIRSNQQKSFNVQHSRSRKEMSFGNFQNRSPTQSLSSRENSIDTERENIHWYSKNRDLNSNIEIGKNTPSIETKSSMNDEKITRGQELRAIAKNFVPKASLSFNLFEHYTLSPEISHDGVNSPNYEQSSRVGTVGNFFQNHTNLVESCSTSNTSRPSDWTNNAKASSFAGFENCKSTDNFSSQKCRGIVNDCSEVSSRCDFPNISRNQRKNFGQTTVENPKIAQRTKNLTNFRVLSQITNYDGNYVSSQDNNSGFGNSDFVKNRGNTKTTRQTTKDNNYSSSNENICPRSNNLCQNRQDQAQYFVQQKLNCQPTIVNNRYASQVFDNYFRGINGHNGVSTSSQIIDRSQARQEILFPLGRFVPQSFYNTSSFADYRAPQIYTERGNPRPILSRMSARVGDEV